MKDSRNISRIEALRGEFEKLRHIKIRVEADIDRATADIEKHKATARDEIGTDDLEQIRSIIKKRDEENTNDVAAFETLMAEIRNGIAQLADGHSTKPEAARPGAFRNRMTG